MLNNWTIIKKGHNIMINIFSNLFDGMSTHFTISLLHNCLASLDDQFPSQLFGLQCSFHPYALDNKHISIIMI